MSDRPSKLGLGYSQQSKTTVVGSRLTLFHISTTIYTDSEGSRNTPFSNEL